MTTRDRLTLAAAAAVALAASALTPVYADLGWLVRVLGAVGAVATAAALGRAAGLPRALQPVAAVLGLAAYVVVVFARSTLAWGLLPGTDTLALLTSTVSAGLVDVEELGPPVPTRPGLVLLAVLGAGAVAVVVDLLAVVLRRVALAGVPLLLLFAVPAAVLPGGLGTLPFVLGAVGWLALLLADGSDRAARWGTPLQVAARRRAGGAPGIGRTGRRIGAAALSVAVVVPALLPGFDGRLLGGRGEGGGDGGARSTTTYNPLTRLSGQLRLPGAQRLLTYRTEDGAGDYLRLTTLDRFDERSGWSSSELAGDLEDDAVQSGIPTPSGQNRTATRTATTEIRLSSRLDGPWLPVPFPPSSIEIEGPWIWDLEAETAFSTRTRASDVDGPYIVRATPVEPTPDQLRRATAAPEAILKTYGQAPQVSDYVRELVARTTAGAATDYDRVVALQALFRDGTNGFRYDVDAPAPGTNASDALENFLRGRVGFCEQYASAMGAMTRSLGIPSRVAVGFLPGRLQPDGSYLVTTDEAHAWPEVWFRGAGWVRFEPTPRSGRISTPSYSTPSVAPEEAAAADAGPAAPAAPVPGDGATPEELDRAGADGALDTSSEVASGSGPSRGWLLAVPLTLLAASLPGLLGAARRRSRLRTAGAGALWDVLQDDGTDVGHRWRPADSPRAAARHLVVSRRVPHSAEPALLRLAAAAERARYARPGSADGGEGVDAGQRRDLATVRGALLGASPSGTRWRARLLPASALRWARAGIVSRSERVVERVDQRRADLRRAASARWARRRLS